MRCRLLWRRKWQPTPVFLPGKSHEQRSLAWYSSWCHKELETTERLTLHHYYWLQTVFLCITLLSSWAHWGLKEKGTTCSLLYWKSGLPVISVLFMDCLCVLEGKHWVPYPSGDARTLDKWKTAGLCPQTYYLWMVSARGKTVPREDQEIRLGWGLASCQTLCYDYLIYST